MSNQCDFCGQIFVFPPRLEHSINICDTCAEAALRRSVPEAVATGEEREKVLNAVRASLAKNLDDFANSGEQFDAAPDATPEDKRLAAIEVLRSLFSPNPEEEKGT